tara:strand:- start:597 stop:827 length:231 start_codon:yes stop_codon:yes gene_type:complete
MYRKILDALTILSTILVLGILGGSFFTYRYLTSESFQKQMMDKVLGGVGNMMPKVLDNNLPKMTGPSLPLPQKPKL